MAFHSLEEFIAELRAFNAARNWGQFHSPKNIAICYAAEVLELVELLYPLTDNDAFFMVERKTGTSFKAQAELADCYRNLVLLHDVLGLHPEAPAVQVPHLSVKRTVQQLLIQANLLLQPFMWCTEEESKTIRHNLKHGRKVVDSLRTHLAILHQIAAALDVDLIAISSAKHQEIEAKYPVEKAFGNSAKYTEHAKS